MAAYNVWLCSDILQGSLHIMFGSSVGSVMRVLTVSEMIREDVPSAHAYLISSPSFPVPTGPPQGLMVTNRTATTITLSWMDPAPDRINDRDGITGFVVRRNGERVARIEDRSYTVTGLTPATSYEFVVLARNQQGTARNSNAARLTESTDLAPTPTPSPTPPPQGQCNIQLCTTLSLNILDPTPCLPHFKCIYIGCWLFCTTLLLSGYCAFKLGLFLLQAPGRVRDQSNDYVHYSLCQLHTLAYW